MAIKRLSILICGKVQGVFFRATAKKQADYMGVSGFVRNESNGDVYIEAVGDDDQLEMFTVWCSRGPSQARVDKITIEELTLENFDAFRVR